jgi:hypothetical protein
MATVMMRLRRNRLRGAIDRNPLGDCLCRNPVVQARKGRLPNEGTALSHWMVVPAGGGDLQNRRRAASCSEHQAQQQPEDPQTPPHGMLPLQISMLHSPTCAALDDDQNKRMGDAALGRYASTTCHTPTHSRCNLLTDRQTISDSWPHDACPVVTSAAPSASDTEKLLQPKRLDAQQGSRTSASSAHKRQQRVGQSRLRSCAHAWPIPSPCQVA